VRIALHATGEVGTRAGRILLAERSLTALGLYGQSGRTEDRRTMAIRSLEGFAVLVTDDPAPASLAAVAASSGISCVSVAEPRGRSIGRRFHQAGVTLLAPTNLQSIATTLAAHEMARNTDPAEVAIAWTEEGRPSRRGVAVPFPDPVGARWARRRRQPRRRRASTRLVAPVPGPWAGALAQVSTDSGEELTVGVADDGLHLAAIALAAGAITVAEGEFPPGIHRPSEQSAAYLAAALRVGLGVASYQTGR
jgi:hypothetical protein